MKKIWNYLNGKKTIVGGVLTLTIGFLTIKGFLDGQTATFLLSLSGLILGVGVSHKIAKAV